MLDCPLHSPRFRPTGFTLIELLVVITIIVVLIGILLPVIGKIRLYSQEADTKNWVNELGSAIERYQQDFKAYPGPLANNEMDLGDTQPQITYNSILATPGYTTGFGLPSNLPTGAYDISEGTLAVSQHFTMSENLVLGLLGGLHADIVTATQLDYDPSAVGGGPVSLSTVLPPKRYPPYLDSKQLSWQTGSNGKTGHFYDEAGPAYDTIIPCFVDRFTNPMPILYMRAKVGANPQPGDVTADQYADAFNPIVTDDFTEAAPAAATAGGGFVKRAGQYDISQIIAYTGAYTGTWPTLVRDTAIPPTGISIGIGKSAKWGHYTAKPAANNLYHGLQMQTWSVAPATYPQGTPTLTSQYPYDAYPYLVGSAGQVRQKDGFILISAGPDRVYGTEDDICNFGTAGQ